MATTFKNYSDSEITFFFFSEDVFSQKKEKKTLICPVNLSFF